MLCLSRKLHEVVVITCPNGDELRVRVVDIDRNKIRLGIEGPREYIFMRSELVEGYHETDSPTPHG